MDNEGRIKLAAAVTSSVLPAGASTAAHQVTMITALQLIDDLRAALATVAGDQLRTDVISSALPAGAATAAHQVTQNTALQLIDNLVTALQSVATDRLIVRGEDQLFSFKGVYQERQMDLNTPAGGSTLSGAVVPAGEVWIVQNFIAFDVTSACAYIRLGVDIGGTRYFIDWLPNPAAAQVCGGPCFASMKTGDRLAADFSGVVLNDDTHLGAFGYKMTLET